ncbi:MAG: ABC transporter permease subunit [Chloroflexi bacterium AL-W]|nr:ABC transporter permease subunit [Chloroflexi bacterium AL-N1]NOK67433.1 ABC transporter permease subunit [Chloroflexi bacterium AL-N10]NOK75075.1 ABC transporter permease subunit [Chloroflexi bacterium AL-N5]NOK81862.1 ABC transporter permease subunit [Chloroflexi bacterium AL-W]NOK89708.1 ABC transporter permease subunit [Chloroflexi bacterium AL-N15]
MSWFQQVRQRFGSNVKAQGVPPPAATAQPPNDVVDDFEDNLDFDGHAQQVATASQFQLIWWRFRKNRVAVFCAFVVAMYYLVAIFADFIAPHDPNTNRSDLTYAPPQSIQIFDQDGNLTRPHVLGYTMEVNLETYRREFMPDPEQRHNLGLFVRGEPYMLWGIIETDRRLFGVTNPEASAYILGGDRLGRDMLSRLIHGTRISMSISLIGIFLSLIVGVTLGGISGYYAGNVDMVIQRFMEFIDSIPKIPILMGLSAAIPLTWPPLAVFLAITVILSLVGWIGMARVVRGRFLSLREEDFVMAARVAGANERRVMFRHMLPSFYSHIIAALTLSIPGAIIGETALSFLGLGLKPPLISFGVLLQEAQNVHTVALAPWLIAPAGVMIVLVLAFNYLGDGLRDAADPYAN